MAKHVLYFSKKCRFSQAFLEELHKTPYMKEFTFVCVDPSPSRPPLPKWLKSVPVLIPAGSDEPLIGPGPVNNWLFERKLGGNTAISEAQRKTADRNAPLAQPIYSPDIAPRPTVAPPQGRTSQPPVNPTQPTGEIDAYHPAEMGNSRLSDAYSFLTTTHDSGDKMFNPIIRNFESLVTMNSPNLGASSTVAQPKRNPKEQAQLDAMERYMAARDADIPVGPNRR